METKIFLFAIITCHILFCAGISCAESSGRSCDLSGDFVVLKEDARGRRLFIKAKEEEVKDLDIIIARLKAAANYIKQCKSGWNDKWSISFFTEKKYATYKDDESVRSYLMDGSWLKSYLAEYSNRKRLLTRYPTDPKKIVFNKIDLPEFRRQEKN